MHGFYRVAAAVPELQVGGVSRNAEAVLTRVREAAADGAVLVTFPEMCLTGYTCADLFHQTALLDRVVDRLGWLLRETRHMEILILIGIPVRHQGRLYNCGALLQAGSVLGVVPKSHLPNYKEFYERRWFSSGVGVVGETVRLCSQSAPFGTDLLFVGSEEFVLGIEICEDLWTPVPPSSRQALAGATVLANLSASNELVTKAEYRRDLVRGQSARCTAAYVYTSAGVGESTTDLVFSGHAIIAENGVVLAQNERFEQNGTMLTADVDCSRLVQTRIIETGSGDAAADPFRRVPVQLNYRLEALRRRVDPHPFVPADPARRDQRCREIFTIQATALARRLEHAHAQTAVIGISGGLDSTLALLVTGEAWKRLGQSPDRILAVTMPGFGTTGRTRTNAEALVAAVGAELRTIDITPACTRHFEDIGHDPDCHDVTYENVQARERTQLLMDLANKHRGLVIGTGDLSEMALGWSTYNGDHMSMYAVNCSVPKTLVRYVIGWAAEQAPETLRRILHDILDTPVSPELLPGDERGEIAQKTEEVIGPYELHDFFLYHAIKYGAAPDKILYLAELAFQGRHDRAAIARWLRVFVGRFFAQQFKRSCIPDGPKVGTVSLSPRGDWRMPSDAAGTEWMRTLDSTDPK